MPVVLDRAVRGSNKHGCPWTQKRRGRDSNPRSLSRLISLATSHIHPFCHLSNFRVSFHAVRLCLKFLFINYSTEVYAPIPPQFFLGSDMLAFQAPPLPRQGQTIMSVKTKKYVALHRVGLCFQVPKTCVIPLYHKAMRLSELHGNLWLM